MKLDDLIVEVRDRNFARVGRVTGSDLQLEIAPVSNGVGSWSLTLPLDHRLTALLRQPGSGIVVTGPDDVLISGPTTNPESNVSADDTAGTIKFAGSSDDIVLWDRLAYPDPSTIDTMAMATDYDVRHGPAETVMHEYVEANVGPSAPGERRHAYLAMSDDEGRGPTIKKSARFEYLGDLLADIAGSAGLSFRVVQRGDGLAFETNAVVDHTGDIRLDVTNGTLEGHRVAVNAPTATKAIVGAMSPGLDRLFATVTTTEADKVEEEYGRRVERFLDQAYTPDEEVWTQGAVELLASEGLVTVTAQALPGDDSTMRFGADWNLGDRVTVVVEGQELASPVTGFILKADTDGVRVGVVLGDATGFNPALANAKRIRTVETKVSQMQRNLSTSSMMAGDSGTPVAAFQDQITATGSGTQTLVLSYVPMDNSEHLYWQGAYQPGSEWSRDSRTVTIPDPDGLIEAGDVLAMEYLYNPLAQPPAPSIFTMDLPAYDVFEESTATTTNALSTPDTATEITMDQSDHSSALVGHYGLGPDLVNMPTPDMLPAGAVLDKIEYVIISYREDGHDLVGVDESDLNPDPLDAPFITVDSSYTAGYSVIDHLPLGGYAGETIGRFTESLYNLDNQHPADRIWMQKWDYPDPAPIVHLAYLAIRLTYTVGG